MQGDNFISRSGVLNCNPLVTIKSIEHYKNADNRTPNRAKREFASRVHREYNEHDPQYTTPGSTQSMLTYSSSPKSPMRAALAIQGFHTTQSALTPPEDEIDTYVGVRRRLSAMKLTTSITMCAFKQVQRSHRHLQLHARIRQPLESKWS